MTPETFASIVEGAAAVFSVAALVLGFYVRSVAGSKCENLKDEFDDRIDDAKKDFDAEIKAVTSALYSRLNGLGDRVQHLESSADGNARREDVHNLSLQLMSMAGDMKAIAAKMEALGENSHNTGLAIKRLENHLLHIEG